MSNRSPPHASRKTPPASRHDQARAGEVPERPEREDRRVELAGRDHHGIEHQALTSRGGRHRESPRHLVAPTDDESLRRDHDDARRRQRCRRPDVDRLGGRRIERGAGGNARGPRPAAPDRPPATAERRRRQQPTTISPSTSRAIAVAHPGRPNAKLWVPSMPSRIHRLAALPGCGPTSSPTTASAGRSRRSTSSIACSVSKSTCETGSAVRLVDRRQVLAGEVRQRDGVGAVGEREGQCELARPRRHHMLRTAQPALRSTGVDARRLDRDDDPGRPSGIHRPQIGPAVLGADSAGEGVVVVGFDAGISPQLEVAGGVRLILDVHADHRVRLQVLGLLAIGVEREAHDAVFGEEPHRRRLRATVASDRRQRGDRRLQ